MLVFRIKVNCLNSYKKSGNREIFNCKIAQAMQIYNSSHLTLCKLILKPDHKIHLKSSQKHSLILVNSHPSSFLKLCRIAQAVIICFAILGW